MGYFILLIVIDVLGRVLIINENVKKRERKEVLFLIMWINYGYLWVKMVGVYKDFRKGKYMLKIFFLFSRLFKNF